MTVYTYWGNKDEQNNGTSVLQIASGPVEIGKSGDFTVNEYNYFSQFYVLKPGVVQWNRTDFPWQQENPLVHSFPAAGSVVSGARWLTLPKGWDETWKAALAANGSTPAWMLALGDSVTNGIDGTGTMVYTNGFVELLRANILARPVVSLYADHWPAWAMTPGFGNPAGSLPYGAVASCGTNTGGLLKLLTVNSPAGTVTFTTPYACTRIDVDYVDFASGTFGVSIDGGADTVITTTNGGSFSGASLKKATFTGLANTVHTVTIHNASAANVANLQGIDTYASTTAGIGFVRQGYSSQRAVDFANSIDFPANKIALWSAATTQAQISNFPVKPSLILIELGLNDIPNFGGFDGTSRTVADAVTTNTSQSLSSATAAFSALDIGATVSGAGIPVGTYIRPEDGIVSGSGVNMSNNATATASGVTVTITRPPATVPFEDALGRFVRAFRRAVDDCSIMFVIPNYPDTTSDNAIGNRQGRVWGAYKKSINAVAAEYGCAVADLDAKWGGTPVGKGFMISGNIHPTAAGHADYATLLEQAI